MKWRLTGTFGKTITKPLVACSLLTLKKIFFFKFSIRYDDFFFKFTSVNPFSQPSLSTPVNHLANSRLVHVTTRYSVVHVTTPYSGGSLNSFSQSFLRCGCLHLSSQRRTSQKHLSPFYSFFCCLWKEWWCPLPCWFAMVGSCGSLWPPWSRPRSRPRRPGLCLACRIPFKIQTLNIPG